MTPPGNPGGPFRYQPKPHHASARITSARAAEVAAIFSFLVIVVSFIFMPGGQSMGDGCHRQCDSPLYLERLAVAGCFDPAFGLSATAADRANDISSPTALGGIHPRQKLLRGHGSAPMLFGGVGPGCDPGPTFQIYQWWMMLVISATATRIWISKAIFPIIAYLRSAGRDHPAPSAHVLYALL